MSTDERLQLAGVWKVISQKIEFQDGGPPGAPYGDNPDGYLILTTQGRMMAFVARKGRPIPGSDAEAAAAFRSMIAYTGRYTVTGDTWSTRVDGAWNSAWIGTEQVRHFKLDGDRLDVVTMWQPQVNFGGRIGRAIVSWERVK